MRMYGVVVLFLCCGALTTTAWAQSSVDQSPLPVRALGSDTPIQVPVFVEWDGRFEELEKWIADYRSWKTWTEQWGGRREPGWFGWRQRRTRPAPPPWLEIECSNFLASGSRGLLAQGCELLAEWRDDYSTAAV